FLVEFFLSSRRRHTRSDRDWSSDVCSSDLAAFVRGGLNPTHPTHSPKRGVSSPDVLLADGTQRYAIEAKRPQEARNILARFDEEIGRASCRERVVVAVVTVHITK